MNISIIIPTFNGANVILNVLQALSKQTYSGFEVITVIDGSTDNTADLLRKQSFNFQSSKILEQTNKGRSITRNNGAKEANGELLIFLDDNTLPLENCIEKHVEHHTKYPQSILTGAILDRVDNGQGDIQSYKSFLSIKWNKTLRDIYDAPLPKEKIFLNAANCSIPKKLFIELRGFDATLTDAEDYDLAVRAFHKQIPLYYNDQAFVWKIDPITCLSYVRRKREYQAMHKKLFLLRPNLYHSFPIGELKTPTGLKALIFKMFAFRFWIWTADNFNWLRVFPKNLRYRIYDLIITANGVYYPDRVKV